MAAKKKSGKKKPITSRVVSPPPASISKPYTIAEATEDGHRTGYAIGCEDGYDKGQESGTLIGAIFGAVAAFIAALIFAALKFQ